MPGDYWYALLIFAALAIIFFGVKFGKGLSRSIAVRRNENDPLYSVELKIAQKLELSRKYDKAVIAYRQLIEKFPDTEIGYLFLGYLQRRRGDHQAAADAFRGAIKINPDSAESIEELAISLNDSGDRAGAIDLYRKVVDKEPGNIAANGELGMLLYDAGDKVAARLLLERYIQLAGGVKPRGRGSSIFSEASKRIELLRKAQ